MTSSTKRAMPWLVSGGAHLLALSVAAILLAMSPRPAASRVEISLVGGTGFGGGELAARPGTRTAAASATALPARSSARAAAPNTPVGGAAAAASVHAAYGNGGPGLSSPGTWSVDASRTGAVTTAAAPAASDVLNDTESAGGSAGAQDAVGRPDAAAQASGGGAPGAFAAGTEWGWQGPARRLIRKRDPEFPAILSAQGQEVEAEARITVDPAGKVTRVEITRQSGYIEIDESVADALRDYLFSRVEGRADSTGTVKFRFRLERQD